MNLNNKVIVITGGSSGLGKALALAFLKEKAKVVINACSQEELKSVADEIGVAYYAGDVTRENDLKKLADFTLKKYGEIDIWVNNAGLWIPHDYVENFDMARVEKMLAVNVLGPINGSRVALRLMKKKKRGIILNIISDCALEPRQMSSAYTASKWAVNGFTKSIRQEDKNISILAVYPSAMQTDIFGKKKPKKFSSFWKPEVVAQKIVNNLKSKKPKVELKIVKK